MKTVRNRTFKASSAIANESVMSGPFGVTESREPYALEISGAKSGGNVNARKTDWLQLGSHWIRLEELKAHAALKGVIQKGTGKMNSAHVLNVFSKFEDEDWDRALVIWWQALAVFCVFGGAISAAVWA